VYEDFLREIPLFEDLPEEDLTRLCRMVGEVRLAAGEVLFEEGTPADRAFILHDGELEIVKTVDGREVHIDYQDTRGTVIGERALLEETSRLATVRARQDSLLLALGQQQVQELLHASPSAARVILHTLSRRWRGVEGLVHHNERMAQLGTLTAGLAHELNNPVAAVVRGSQQLESAFDEAQQARANLDDLGLSDDQRRTVEALAARCRGDVDGVVGLDPVTLSDLTDDLEGWLDDHDVEDGWEVAPTLVAQGLRAGDLDTAAAVLDPGHLPALVRWLAADGNVRSLLHDVSQGAARIADTVRTLKSYSHLDQAPVQNLDLHQGLDDAITLLRSRLEPGVVVLREYAEALPTVPAYGSELNQVWTSLVTNAVDAMDGAGILTLRTRAEDTSVVVEVEDDGPGIAAEHLPKVFDPFFTTKEPGKGAGLGLNVAYHVVTRHRGEIVVTSQPGRTVVRVSLPLAGPPPSVSTSAPASISRS